MNTQQAKNFCDEWLKKWTQNQPEELLAFYTKNAYYQDPDVPDGIRGHVQLQQYFSKLLPTMSSWEFACVEVFLIDSGFFMKWQLSIPRDGYTLVRYGMDLIKITGQKINRNEVYIDRFKAS